MMKELSLQEQIAEELRRKEKFSVVDLRAWIEAGDEHEAVTRLVFFATPGEALSMIASLREELAASFGSADGAAQGHYIRFLGGLVLGLRSFLPRWNLQNRDRHSDGVLTGEQLETEAAKVQALASRLASQAPAVVEKLLDGWRAEATARLEAEKAPDPEGEAKALVGNSIDEYLTNVVAGLNESNLRRIAEMMIAGQTPTELGNDYAAFLQYTMHIGVSFVTCNPVLVDIAWVADPERWTPIVDGIIKANLEADDAALARLVTLEIVLANMLLLRPIFLLGGGKKGLVSLQVNPKKHDDAEAMISDALSIYEELQAKLGGGVPNVVFKLPGTLAGLAACRELTGRGIGVNITVNFGLFQELRFAEVINEGKALYACLTEMNGRLAYPVRDELLGKLDELAAYGIDEGRARLAAAWSGVAIHKRLCGLLGERGYDLDKVKPLVASLRIYEDGAYEVLPTAFLDITELIGTSIITVFPNVRYAFDTASGIELDARRIDVPVPDEMLEILTHSEIFKQGYYVADRDWLPTEDERFRPDYELALEDEEGTIAWTPVRNTITQFSNSYDEFVERILERRRLIAK